MITWFFVTLVLTVTGWISWKVRKRRHETWLQRDRYHVPLPSVAAARKLGIERPEPDYEAEIAAIEEFARKRGRP